MQDIKPQKICHSIASAVECSSHSRSYIFESIKSKKLKSFKRGHRRFILHSDLVEFILSESNQGEVKQ
jgi:hypothetical protein